MPRISARARKEMEWELGRLVAAFGMENVETDWNSQSLYGLGLIGGSEVSFRIDIRERKFADIYIYDFALRESCQIYENGIWKIWWTSSSLQHLLARALYCLDFNESRVIAELNCPLSMHEQLELRLSMPREFWPQKWRDEEKEGGEARPG